MAFLNLVIKNLERNASDLIDFSWLNRFKINCRNGIALFIFFLWGASDEISFLQLLRLRVSLHSPWLWTRLSDAPLLPVSKTQDCLICTGSRIIHIWV